MTLLALDTSVAIPLLVRSHTEHLAVARWWAGRDVVLSGHAAVETYSVLTRLPGDARVSAVDAARLMSSRFGPPLVLDPADQVDLPHELARAGIVGGAAYDAVVALAAMRHGAVLATRDGRARLTYEAIGVRHEVVG
ncbi:type II toxin-antitoxin system VapC family toxin [Dermatophilaceae bacterium Soc4.6]